MTGMRTERMRLVEVDERRPGFAFAFYMTHWDSKLVGMLATSMESLTANGGSAAAYPRYLIFSGDETPEIKHFCDEYSLTLQLEPRLTVHRPLPNKALLCRAPEHEVVCLTDLDIVFLADPTPMFAQVADTTAVHCRPDLNTPLERFAALPCSKLLTALGERVWRAQYARFGPGTRVAEVARRGGGTMPMYFNTGVAFIPGRYLRRLGQIWWSICSTFLRDARFRRPYLRLLMSWVAEQLSFALAVHREQIPWQPLPSAYNLIPIRDMPPEDTALVLRGNPVMLHLVHEVREWLSDDGEQDCPESCRPLFRRVRENIRARWN